MATQSEVGGPCSDSSGCYSAEACLGGYCCNFADSHMTPSSGMWENFYYCNSCGEGDGVCTACQETHFLKSGSQYGAYCAEVCDDDQYQSGSILSYCTDKKQAGVGCSSDEQCLSGKCGGDYCCDDSASSQNDGFGYVCELCRSLVGDCVSKQRILCSENEYVSSNYCLTCPAGSFNAADDDASGVNTTCDVSPTSSPPPCDASIPLTNGGAGNCTSSLASGSMCQPTCDSGYTVSGTSSCDAGTLTAAMCSANPCSASTDSSKDGSDGTFYCINGGTVGGTTGSCTCTSCDAGYEGLSCEAEISSAFRATVNALVLCATAVAF